jgi:plastocyanin
VRKLLPGSVSLRALALAAPLAAAISLVLAPGLAGAAVTPTGVTDTIHITEGKGFSLKFVAPKTVTQGDDLEIINETNPKRVGPHTFSLVTKGSLPKTKPARQKCFTPNHICIAIAKWHGATEKTPPTKNPAKAGVEGWSTMGNLNKKGDSWFTGNKPGTSFSQQVTAQPGTIYFMCAIHPWMQGKVNVVAPPVGVPGV